MGPTDTIDGAFHRAVRFTTDAELPS